MVFIYFLLVRNRISAFIHEEPSSTPDWSTN